MSAPQPSEIQRVQVPHQEGVSIVSVAVVGIVSLCVGLGLVRWSLDETHASAKAPTALSVTDEEQATSEPETGESDDVVEVEAPSSPPKSAAITPKATTPETPKPQATRPEPPKPHAIMPSPEPEATKPETAQPTKVAEIKTQVAEAPNPETVPTPTGTISRLKRGRLAYIQCTGAERADGYPCPRDKGVEAKTWRILNSLVTCGKGPRVPGNADIRLIFRGTTRAPEIKFREMDDDLPYGKIKACVEDKVSELRTSIEAERLVISFRFTLL